MRRLIVLTSVLTLLGAGSAAAFDATRGFGPSDANDQPVPRFQQTDDRIDRSAVTAGIGTERSFGFPAGANRTTDRSAAMGFGPSDANDQPVPRFQTAR